MNIIGNIDPFADIFPPSLLPWVFRTIFKEWNNFHRTTRTPLENRITKPFIGHLQFCQENRHLPFFFDALVKLANPEKDIESGELDIRVMHGMRPKVFFAFECKRLNVIRNGKYASLAGEYVGQEGMGCFLSGKYDGGGDCGGQPNLKPHPWFVKRSIHVMKPSTRLLRMIFRYIICFCHMTGRHESF